MPAMEKESHSYLSRPIQKTKTQKKEPKAANQPKKKKTPTVSRKRSRRTELW
jgi:hypothetical protein